MPSPPPDTTRIPREYLGAARSLYKRIDVASAATAAQTRAIADRLRDAYTKHNGKIPPSTITAARFKWERLDTFGRLELEIERPGQRLLNIAELRVSSASMRYNAWLGDAREPSFSVELLTLIVGKECFDQRSECLACFSLHAIARRLERGDPRYMDDAAIFGDMAAALTLKHQRMPNRRGRSIPVPSGGFWAGEFVDAVQGDDNTRVLSIRTFLPERIPLQRSKHRPQPICGYDPGLLPALAQQT